MLISELAKTAGGFTRLLQGSSSNIKGLRDANARKKMRHVARNGGKGEVPKGAYGPQ